MLSRSIIVSLILLAAGVWAAERGEDASTHSHDHDHHLHPLHHVHAETHPWTAAALTTVSGMAATLGAVLHCFLRPLYCHEFNMPVTRRGIRCATGGGIVVLWGIPSKQVLGHLLSFAAGVMLFISYGDLLPDASRELHSSLKAGIWVCGPIIHELCAEAVAERALNDMSLL